MNNLSTK